MSISKAQWSTEGNSVRLSMPIAKVDQERRIVSGFATLDNVDRQGDIVPTDASIKAFKQFRGNVREMHQQVAVGKVVSFKEDKYFDADTKKFYNGVFVSAYVSKGAQDTWEKVLDGTLTGFSIGGNIKNYEDIYSEDIDKSIRIIKDYELYELSLVDNPANQFANVISIEKNHDSGYLAKMSTENVFWCGNDDIVQISADASSDCPRCDKGMQNIGFVETNDAEKADVVKTILSRIKNEAKEVSKMAEEIIETSIEEVEVEKTVDAPVAEVETVEKADEEETAEKKYKDKMDHDDEDEDKEMDKAVEAETAEAEVSKSEEAAEETADVAKAISETITSTLDTLADTVKALNEKIEELHKSVAGIGEEVASVTKDVAGVSNEVKEFKGSFDEFGKRVDAVEKDTAFRKSGDLGEIVQEPVMVQKSLWGGRFLTKSDLFS
jgi:soluble cytochrome b562